MEAASQAEAAHEHHAMPSPKLVGAIAAVAFVFGATVLIAELVG